MFQQTSISDFFKFEKPKTSKFDKKLVISKQDTTTLKKKPRGYGRMMETEPPLSTSPEKTFNNSEIDSLIDSRTKFKEEPSSPKTPKSSSRHDFSSPTSSGKKNLKRSNSRSSLSSPRKKSQSNGSRSVTKHLKHRSHRKLFLNESTDAGKVSDMVENLSLSRSGLFLKNNMNLENFYSETNCETEVIDLDVDEISSVYDINRVIIPRDKHAEHLFGIITQVFSNSTNCGYFNDQELDMVFEILCLSNQAQMLLARMLKRKRFWRRADSIQYPEIGDDLTPYFDELERQNLIKSDLDNESLATLLTMLLADEIHDICRQSKIPKQSNKDLAIKKLMQNSSIKSLFPGVESPAIALRKRILNVLDHCVCLPEEVVSLVDRIVTLFIPSEDVTTKLSDIFLKLTMIKEGTLRFPEVPVQYYPVFENREHLVRYVERRTELRQALEMPKGAKENCEIFKTLGRNAHSRLMQLLGENQSSQQEFLATPRHLLKFREEYVCIKIVTACLAAFKKEDSTVKEAVEMLKNLISQAVYLQSKKSEWYEELALIEMKHRKNLETAAFLTIAGLNLPNITETGKHVLSKRASALAKRKSGIDAETKSKLTNLIDKELLGNVSTVSINANVMQGNLPGRKSTWSVDIGGDKGYMSVEHRAKYYYTNNGYPEGWHCEGSLPLTLFTLLFWDELYGISVTAAYLSAYQTAPLDLFTSEFYNNRKEQLENRIRYIESLSSDQLCNLIEESLEIRQHYQSLMPSNLPVNGERLREVVQCIGTSVVVGICKRLASNFCGWNAGFPDLLVWNPNSLKCKFVEVKGPGDTLSAKQTLWLRYLDTLGAVTELCIVKAVGKNQ